MRIRKFDHRDFENVREIYSHGIKTKNATFETSPPDLEAWHKKFIPEFSIVPVINDCVIGWAALSRTSNRKVYEGVCEITVYVHKDYSGKGIGGKLILEEIRISEENGIWTLQASIFPENKVSIHLHKKHGFRIVGIREKIGKMGKVWRDTVLPRKEK